MKNVLDIQTLEARDYLASSICLTRCRELGILDAQICFSCLFLENNLSDLENFYILKSANLFLSIHKLPSG